MKIISRINLDNWKSFCICGNCTSKLEIEESDILCRYKDRHTAWVTIKNDKVYFYCVYPTCKNTVDIYTVPGTIAERVKAKNPPPPEPKLTWKQILFG
jgi:hypothetical protein